MVFYIPFISTDFLIFILISLVIFVISLSVLRRFIGKAPSTTAAISIALMTSYFLSYNNFLTIKEIYSLGGTTFTLLIPGVIAFFFIYKSSINSLLRKLFWIFYGSLSVYLLINYNSPKIIVTMNLLIIILIIIFDNTIKNILNTKENLKIHNK